jgi:hypothetical protein
VGVLALLLKSLAGFSYGDSGIAPSIMTDAQLAASCNVFVEGVGNALGR